MDITAFLHLLYASTGLPRGYLSVWDLQTSRTAYFDVASAGAFDRVQTYVDDRVGRRFDTYFGVGLRRAELPENQRGGKREVLSIPALWLDVDIAGPGHKSKKLKLPESLEEAISIVELYPKPPSVIIHSGGGIHCYWLLDRPFEITATEASRINAATKNFQDVFIDGAAERGLHVDQTGNIDRVLRLPATFNFKSEPPRPVEVLLCDDVRYSMRDLVAAASNATVAIPKAMEGGSTDFADVVKARLPNLANHDNREMMQKIVRGESFADPGERDSTLQRAASCAAFVLSPKEASTADAAALAKLFERSIAAMTAEADDPENPALTMEQVVDKVSRALDDRARTLEADQAILAHFKSPAPAAAEDGQPPTDEAATPAETKDIRAYTDDDIIAFAAKHKCDPPQNFIRRWIIQHGSSYYVFADGKYKSPVAKEALMTHLREDLKPAEGLGIRLWTPTKAGGDRAKTIPEVLRDYATGARHCKGSFFLDESHFDAETETYWEAVCPLREIEPTYDPKIEAWLNLLGGAESSKLLDWIATVWRLDLQTSALYLSGQAGSGKTMLAHGLARLWNTSGPTLLEDVAGTAFNGDITRCPLVFGDEEVKCSTSELRRLVGSSSHKLKRKYLSNVDIEGALRIMLADNPGRLIHGHDHSGADIEAVASKFLHIVVGKAPTEYLRDIGGRKGTDGWVDGDKIAAHALWLALNRTVELGNRLAVEGLHSRMAQMLVLQDRVTGVICEWIARYLESPTAVAEQVHGMLIGGGQILVSAEVIAKFWTSYVASERAPFSIGKIGRALASLSDARVKVGARRYHAVRPELVYTWADENLSCDVDDLRRWVDAPVGTPRGPTSPPAASTPTPPAATPPVTPPAGNN